MTTLLNRTFDLSGLMQDVMAMNEANARVYRMANAIPPVTPPTQSSLLPYLTPSEACKAQSTAIAAALAHLERGRVMEAQVVLHAAEEACAETLTDIAEHDHD